MALASSDTGWMAKPVRASLSPTLLRNCVPALGPPSPITQDSSMSQETTEAPAMPGTGHGQTKAKTPLLLGTDRKRSRLNRTRQDLWDDTSWNHRLSRATSAPRGTRARGTAHGRVRTLWTPGESWGRKGLEGIEMPPLKAEPSRMLGP